MPSHRVELEGDDLEVQHQYRPANQHRAPGLVICFSVDPDVAEGNVKALLKPLTPEQRVRVLHEVFNDVAAYRTAAAAALQQIEADEAESAEREFEAAEERSTYNTGPHGNCGGPCCQGG